MDRPSLVACQGKPDRKPSRIELASSCLELLTVIGFRLGAAKEVNKLRGHHRKRGRYEDDACRSSGVTVLVFRMWLSVRSTRCGTRCISGKNDNACLGSSDVPKPIQGKFLRHGSLEKTSIRLA